MTKEEYQSLLQSDYWKGYSYSLIKERNFTCEDCGRTFYNERNKLQVHHLVYRDIYPWSYKPEEMVVLCEDCHRKRHGLPPKTVDHSYYPFDAPTHSNGSYAGFGPQPINNDEADRYAGLYPQKSNRATRIRFVLICIIILCSVASLNLYIRNKEKEDYKKTVNTVEYRSEEAKSASNEEINVLLDNYNKKKKIKTKAKSKSSVSSDLSELENFGKASLDAIEETFPSSEVVSSEKKTKSSETKRELSTLELLERQSHADAVKQAKRAGVSTEGSTLDILERISHADAVKQAKRAGVSTEGSTLDILERISHADAVKQAKRAGVSTEGSTLDILERISHADAVKQAKRAGVSTEGSTLEILERITRKDLERYQ